MSKFCLCSNNGVKAVISHEDAVKFAMITKSGGDPMLVGVKVFTFCSPELLERYPESRKYFTGTWETLDILLKKDGNEIDNDNSQYGWSGFVPFSNCRYKEEEKYITTLTDAMDAFGL